MTSSTLALARPDVEDLLAGALCDNTTRARKADADTLFRWLDESGIGLLELTRRNVLAYRAWCLEQWSTATTNRRLSTLRLITAELHAEQLIDRDPMRRIKGKKVGRVSPLVRLSRDQARALVAAATADPTPRGVRDRALLRLGLRTALRKGELLSLTPAHFTESQGVCVITYTKKGNELYQTKIPDTVRADVLAWLALLEQMDQRPLLDQRPVFRGLVGPRCAGPLSHWRPSDALSRHGIDRIVSRHAAAAGLPPLSPHCLRATFITLALAQGVPVHRVAYAVGHADIRTTLRYDQQASNLEDHPTDYLAGI